jgi:predicted RNase H-like HicB family nuclease
MLRYSVLLEPNEGSGVFTVTVPALPGIVTQGDTFEEALAMARDAIELHLEGLLADGDEVPIEHEPPILASVEVTSPAALAPA